MSAPVMNISRILFVLLFVLSLWAPAAGSYTVEKILDSGEDHAKVVWVVLAEGYTLAEQEQFRADAAEIIDVFFQTPPFDATMQSVNVYTVFTPSRQSGADRPSVGHYVDTAFDATFDTYGIGRLLTVNEANAFRAAAEVPHFDVVFVMVNDEQYGGSGGSLITFSQHEAAAEIALHEAGHVIGKLADEYETAYPGFPDGDQEPNVTFQTSRARIPWSAWINNDTELPTPNTALHEVGLFEGARYQPSGIFRPRHTCKMRQLNKPFCEICSEAIVLSMYNLIVPIESASPPELTIPMSSGSPLTLRVFPQEHDPERFAVLWEIDGAVADTHDDPYVLNLYPSRLRQGSRAVTVWMTDLTPLVKTDPLELLNAGRTWEVTKNFCSGSLSGAAIDARSGMPVAEAAISIEETGAITYTDAEGVFNFPDILCGEYIMSAEAEGFALLRTHVRIRDGQPQTATAALQPGQGFFYISGEVAGLLDGPVTVMLSGARTAVRQTDTRGRFTIGPLAPGDYTVEPRAHGYRFLPAARTVTIHGSGVANLQFSAKKTGLLSMLKGFIDGNTRQGVLIRAAGPTGATVVSDARGFFQFTDLPSGAYVVTPQLQGLQFDPPQVAVTIPDAEPADLRFAAREVPCPAHVLLDPGEQLERLRTLRSDRLSQTPRGRAYVRRYYLVSPEVLFLLQNNPALKMEAAALLQQCMPVIESMLHNDALELSPEARAALVRFAGHLRSHGSPLLQKILGDFLQDLEQGRMP